MLKGTKAAAIAALADWLHESADETSTAAMIQHFQGTVHEPVFATAQGEVMLWGEEFDVQAEFAGILRKMRREAVEVRNVLVAGKRAGHERVGAGASRRVKGRIEAAESPS